MHQVMINELHDELVLSMKVQGGKKKISMIMTWKLRRQTNVAVDDDLMDGPTFDVESWTPRRVQQN